MQELIKVITNEQNEPVVSGRELHEFLEINEKYNDWFRRMCTYGFEETIDFVSFTVNSEKPLGGRPALDHVLKLDMAKEIAMIQRNEKGKQARLYFIEVEKRYRNELQLKIPQTYAQALRAYADEVEQRETLEIALNQSLKFYTVAKYNRTFKKKWDMSKCKYIGKQMTAFCKANSFEIKPCETNDERFGVVNSYPLTAWELFFKGADD